MSYLIGILPMKQIEPSESIFKGMLISLSLIREGSYNHQSKVGHGTPLSFMPVCLLRQGGVFKDF